jgi:hypothetical protein
MRSTSKDPSRAPKVELDSPGLVWRPLRPSRFGSFGLVGLSIG